MFLIIPHLSVLCKVSAIFKTDGGSFSYYIQIKRHGAVGKGKIEVSFNYPTGETDPAALMSLTLKKGDTVQLGANGDKASWKTSQKSVAAVSKSGLVTAVKKGKAVITLNCGSKTQTIEIIVE